MRLGMSGAFLPARMDDFSAEIAARIRELGFLPAASPALPTTRLAPSGKANRVRDLLADHGLRMYQAIGYRPP